MGAGQGTYYYRILYQKLMQPPNQHRDVCPSMRTLQEAVKVINNKMDCVIFTKKVRSE